MRSAGRCAGHCATRSKSAYFLSDFARTPGGECCRVLSPVDSPRRIVVHKVKLAVHQVAQGDLVTIVQLGGQSTTIAVLARGPVGECHGERILNEAGKILGYLDNSARQKEHLRAVASHLLTEGVC